ncbi:MAG: dTDP-4-dehydrorhamnose reductase [Candidatus Promineofilum sp.]|nr:dTDP-4-dehydrorhamnose reductase [Promineifilum sp.]
MHILITGANGQLGQALQAVLRESTLTLIDLPQVDITIPGTLAGVVRQAQPELVIHCAAYTDVDGCARDPELAHRVNAFGTQNVALACQAADIPMVHVSTNEVFAGTAPGGYEEWMPLAPRNAYGRSKAAAEVHVRSLLSRHYIVRTAWLYAPGGRNFIHAILRRAREEGVLRVVTDEIGNPTHAFDLAQAIAQLITTGQYGIYHFVNSGACSRWAFANEILRQMGMTDVVNRPILSSAFSRPSSPPPFGALHNRNGQALGIILRPWQEALAEYLGDEPKP